MAEQYIFNKSRWISSSPQRNQKWKNRRKKKKKTDGSGRPDGADIHLLDLGETHGTNAFGQEKGEEEECPKALTQIAAIVEEARDFRPRCRWEEDLASPLTQIEPIPISMNEFAMNLQIS